MEEKFLSNNISYGVIPQAKDKSTLQIIDERVLFDKEFRIYGDFENPLFLAKDVANWIGHSNPTEMLKTVDECEKVKIRPKECLGLLTNNNEYNFLTEDGLYEVLMQSRKPIAKQFKQKVKEILKDIRKTGMHISQQKQYEILNNPEALQVIIQNWINEKNERQKLEEENKIQNQQILEMTPKVNYYDTILQSKDAMNVSLIAKDYGMTAIAFNKLLNKHKIQFKQGDIWLLYQKYADCGYTQTTTVKIKHTNGDDGSRTHTKWTQKGRIFLYHFLKDRDILPLIEQ